MSSFEMCFPVKIRSMVSPFLDRLLMSANISLDEAPTTYLHLLWGPDVQVYRLDTTDMGAHATMNA